MRLIEAAQNNRVPVQYVKLRRGFPLKGHQRPFPQKTGLKQELRIRFALSFLTIWTMEYAFSIFLSGYGLMPVIPFILAKY
jgi:hypothetical protein